ncbi:MAG: hypothetical protein JWN76_486 [Chitinophagaceae bacterium]|nr:hypothetical protein [Chitinophagaceae bacterium]
MSAKENILKSINRVAETHFYLRPLLDSALKNQVLTDFGKSQCNGANTYYDYWTASLSDKFHDMATFVRLGTEIELCLKYFYMETKGYSTLVDLQSDQNVDQNIFQRVFPWTNKNVADLFLRQTNYDLDTNQHYSKIQELMLYRHLYAHNSGLLTDRFINNLQRLIGLTLCRTLV